MMLSSILDIGSFFIGMIINLLLVTLMCYYFKKKYESLEEAQNEQAKLLYELLRDKNAKPSNDKNDIDINFKNHYNVVEMKRVQLYGSVRQKIIKLFLIILIKL